jgi:ribosomal protein S18 acetylase RimI-like enzyme
MATASIADKAHVMVDQLANFRRVANLPDGTRVLLRPMQPADQQGVLDLFVQAPREDRRYLRQKVTDPAVISIWFANYDLRRVFPLLAIVNDHVVGDATLHVGEGPHRHLAWMRIYVAPEFRQRGVARLMVESLSDIARKMGLQQILGEVTTNQVKVIKLLESLGFVSMFKYPDHFMTEDGEVFDVDVLMLPLVRKVEYY